MMHGQKNIKLPGWVYDPVVWA